MFMGFVLVWWWWLYVWVLCLCCKWGRRESEGCVEFRVFVWRDGLFLLYSGKRGFLSWVVDEVLCRGFLVVFFVVLVDLVWFVV